MARSEIEDYLRTLEEKAYALGAPAGAISQLARVRCQLRVLSQLRQAREETEGGDRGLLPAPEATSDVAPLYRRLATIAEREGVDPVIVDYLWSREPRLCRLLAGEAERRVTEREAGGGPAVLYGPEGPQAVTVQDRSPVGFGVRLMDEAGPAEGTLVRLVVDDAVGYECFVAYRRFEGPGWRLGLDFPSHPVRIGSDAS